MSWLHYFTYNGPEETYEFDIQDSSKESFASGYTAETGNFTLNVKHSAADAHNAMLQVAPAKQWHIKDIVGKELIEAAKERVETEKDLSPRNLFILNGKKQEAANVVVTQLIFDKPFNIEIEYNGQLQHSRPNQVLADQSALSTLFNQRFDILFANTTQDVATLTMAKTAISNLMGGITYFYGRGIVYHWKDGHKTAVETEPFELITDTPSRTTFPRGFLWDSGFHNLVILKWNPLVSLRILTNWANRIDERGWVAREQIPGEEARSRVPADLRPQNPHFANPPGLLLPLMELVQSLQAETAYMKVISEILSHFERNFYWYIKTQHSQLHPSFMGDGDTSGLFRWRGRSRHHTLTSGLDDYPRGNTPNEYELHTDLATWMIFAARTLRHIKLVLGQNEGNARLQEIEMSTRHALETFHWNDQLGCYCDRTVDEHGNFVFVEHVGYVSIFPLLFGLVDHKSPHLNRLFDIIEDEKQLWTLFGIRSLSASDSFYMKGDQYWTGPIWVNINYLLLGSLKLNYMAEECPYHDRARLIYDRLRTNLIDNMTNQYMKSGFIWEQYDDVDGHGKRSHPFTGWSALITLVITEQYPSSLKA
jgi:mannosyl-oligosaccharide glucosidase